MAYEEENIQLDFKGMLRRRLPIALCAAGVVFLIAVLLIGWLPNRYTAWTTLLVEPQTISPELVQAGVDSTDLNARLHLMTMQILSRARLSKIIDDLGLYENESQNMTREEIIGHMRDQIRVEPVLPELVANQKSNSDVVINTFQLYFTGDSQKQVAAVANRLANDFVDEHIKGRVDVTSSSAEFIEAELVRIKKEVDEVTAAIAQVKGENAGSLPEDLETNYRLRERLLGSLTSAERSLDSQKANYEFYKQQANSAAVMENPTNTSESVTPEFRLHALELQLGEFRSRGFTDKHPDIIKTEAEIQALKERIKKMADGGDLEDDSSKPSKSIAQLQMEAQASKAAQEIQGTQAEMARLRASIDEVDQRIALTPKVAEKLQGLEERLRQLTRNFQDYSNKRLEAKVAAQMERSQKGEQFKVLETAFPPTEPSFPNRKLILVLGTFLGVLLGAGLGFLMEILDSSFHHGKLLQAEFDIPVLASVPAVVFASDRAAARTRRMRLALAAVAATVVVSLVSLTGYFYHQGWPKLFGGEEEKASASLQPESLLYGFLYKDRAK